VCWQLTCSRLLRVDCRTEMVTLLARPVADLDILGCSAVAETICAEDMAAMLWTTHSRVPWSYQPPTIHNMQTTTSSFVLKCQQSNRLTDRPVCSPHPFITSSFPSPWWHALQFRTNDSLFLFINLHYLVIVPSTVIHLLVFWVSYCLTDGNVTACDNLLYLLYTTVDVVVVFQ